MNYFYGDWGLGPIPNPQSPIPNPQSPINVVKQFLFKLKIINNKIFIIYNLKLKNININDNKKERN